MIFGDKVGELLFDMNLGAGEVFIHSKFYDIDYVTQIDVLEDFIECLEQLRHDIREGNETYLAPGPNLVE
jgi:hypothetical protein